MKCNALSLDVVMPVQRISLFTLEPAYPQPGPPPNNLPGILSVTDFTVANTLAKEVCIHSLTCPRDPGNNSMELTGKSFARKGTHLQFNQIDAYILKVL